MSDVVKVGPQVKVENSRLAPPQPKNWPAGDRKTLRRLSRSVFILRSPGRVSRKREFSWIRLETFGNSRPKKFERRSPETIRDEKSPPLAGLSATKEGNSPKRGLPGWGGKIRTTIWRIGIQPWNQTLSQAIGIRTEPMRRAECGGGAGYRRVLDTV
jgi:hypothetical protein